MNDGIIGTPGDTERRALIKTRGLEALIRIKSHQTYEDWRAVGQALLVITEEALAALNLPSDGWDKDNKKVVKEFNRRWEAWEQTAGDNLPPLTAKGKQERWALRELMTNPVYHNWYTTLTGPEQRRLNHPNAIINKYKAKNTVKTPPKGPTKADFKDKVVQLEALVEDLEASREEGNQLTKDSTVEQAAVTLNAMYLPDKSDKIIARWSVLVKERRAAIRAAKKKDAA